VKKLYPRLFQLFLLFLLFHSQIYGQPIPDTATTGWPGGLATLKWDNRNYLITTGANAGYITAAMSTTQAFSIGTGRVTIVMGAGITTTGDDTTFKGITNSYTSLSAVAAPGGSTTASRSVAYKGVGTITLTFDTVASHVAFSLYDLDSGQVATITAKDGSGNALDITMGNASATGINTITGSATTSAAASTTTAQLSAQNSNNGTVNIYILGFSPAGTNGVKSVTITMTGVSGGFALGDIWACIYSDFAATTYYNVSKPFTNEPAYVLANPASKTGSAVATSAGVGNTIGGVALTTGNARYVFKDSSAALKNTYINSFGYDPYNYFLYYVYDAQTKSTTADGNRSIRKYNFNTLSSTTATMTSGTMSTLIADITQSPFFIPVFDQGVESGAACFNNGSFYIGIEGSNADTTINGKGSGSSNRWSMVWRIDFNTGDSVPYQACQAYAGLADNGSGTMYHDWGDISISNDTLYDFNEANSSGGGSPGSFSGWLHYNLKTGLIINDYLNSKMLSGESAIDWSGQVYRFASISDTMGKYTYNGQTSGSVKITGNSAALDWISTGTGDASDAFKPPMDYGDAPASYDPSSGDPAVNDYDSTIKIGTLWNAEFAKKTSANASGDGVTDDGFAIVPIYTHAQGFYIATVKVYNHSGSAATLAGWIDVNENGVFDPGEGTTTNVPTSAAIQNITLTWGPIATIPIWADSMFMRLRLTSASNGMTASNPTGYYSNGETEDYLLTISDILPVKIISFAAMPENNKYVDLNWSSEMEMNLKEYIVQRSDDGTSWQDLQSIEPKNTPDNVQDYSTKDMSPLSGRSYYRIKMVDFGGNMSYSSIQQVELTLDIFSLVNLSPNPFQSYIGLQVYMPEEGAVTIHLLDNTGKTLKSTYLAAGKGTSSISLSELDALPPGMYIVEVINNSTIIQRKVIKQ